MKLRTWLVVASMALEWARVLNAQQNFVAASVSSVVSCVSKGKERQTCAADTRAGVVMLRPTGEATCLLGRNWGYDDQGVWVSEGCGGDIGTGSTRGDAPSATATTAALVEAEGEKSAIETTTTGTNPTLTHMGVFQPYGSLRTIISIPASGSAEVQDNATRVGINFTTFGSVKVIGTAKWGVNLVQSETSLNAGATTSSGFGVVQQMTQPAIFVLRLIADRSNGLLGRRNGLRILRSQIGGAPVPLLELRSFSGRKSARTGRPIWHAHQMALNG